MTSVDGLLVGVDPDDAEDRTEDLVVVDPHAGPDPVEQRAAQEEALGPLPAAVHDEPGALRLGAVDVGAHAVAVLRRDERAHLRLGVGPGADDHRGHPRRDRLDELVADRADGDDDRDRHAALAGRAETGRDGGVGGRTDVGVGQHHHVVLRTAEGLDPLAVPGARLVDVPGDRRAAHEGHRGHARVGQERVHRDGVAVHHVEDAVGHARLLGQLGQEQARARGPSRRA